MSIDAIRDSLAATPPTRQALPAEMRVASGAAADPRSAQAAKDFESVLLHKLLQEMARTVDDCPLLGDDAGSKQAKDMFWYYLSQDLADQGGLGLWKQIAGPSGYADAQQGKKVNP